jgi:Family of unknown function (DUF5338)
MIALICIESRICYPTNQINLLRRSPPRSEHRMSEPPDQKRMRGVGRVTFLAHLAEITAELDAGWPLKVVYQNRSGRLGISYTQFTRYVDRIVRHAGRVPAQARPSLSPPPPMPRAAELSAGPVASEGSNHAGHRPARTFNHDPLEGPDDRRRLLGED